LIDGLGLRDQTLIIVTADHGEEFNDHGGRAHGGPSLYGELVNVPLIMTGPGITPGVRLEEIVQLVDLLPTLVDRLGLAGLDPESIDGLTFADLLEHPRGRPVSSDTDPQEQHDVSHGQPAAIAELRRQVRLLRSTSREETRAGETELDQELIEELRALGYLD